MNTIGKFPYGAAPVNRDWEATFFTWATSPSATEQERCDNAIRGIRNAISNSEALNSRHIKIFVQGSYRNRVNVRMDSDVDVGVMLHDCFLADYPQGKTQGDFGNISSDYTFAQFKNELHEALVNHFTYEAVTRGNKAFDVKANSYRVEADVVPLFEFRHYWDSGNYRAGVALLPDRGPRIQNYPERLLDYWPETPLHYENGVRKNEATSHRFKGMVRILKSLCNEMSNAGAPAALGVPGYLLECLAWNVPNAVFDEYFWTSRVRSALRHLSRSTSDATACRDWCEVDGIKYLFHASQPWTREQAHAFVNAALRYTGEAGT